MEPRLSLKMSQRLVLTPTLQQAIKLLQLSNTDLLDFVEQELENNPLLERSEANDEQSGPRASKRRDRLSPIGLVGEPFGLDGPNLLAVFN